MIKAFLKSYTTFSLSSSQPTYFIMSAEDSVTIQHLQDSYLICGSIQFCTSLLLIVCECLWICKYSNEEVFNQDYIKHIPKLLFINGIIQCLMGFTMMVYSNQIDVTYSDENLIFEGLGLCQQASYLIITFLLGGIVPYIQHLYDNHKKKCMIFWVCVVKIISFLFYCSEFVSYKLINL